MLFLMVLVVLAIALPLNAWIIMMLSGALGHVFGVEQLFISFPEAFVVGLALSVVGSFFKSTVGKS